MCRSRTRHKTDEFGRAGAAASQLAPQPHPYAGPPSVTLDGIVERESGATPTPPPFTVRTAVIALVLMFASGAVLLLLLGWAGLLR